MVMKGTQPKNIDSKNLKNLGADLNNLCTKEVNRRISGCFKEQREELSPMEDK